MKRSIPTIVAFALVIAVAGCSKRPADEQATAFPMPSALAGVYAGSFPCANCKEIAATLWVRADERFVLRQSFVLDSGATESSSYSFGLWRWDETSAEIVLYGRGPDRRLGPIDDGGLQMRTASPIAHVLARDASDPPFTDRVQIEGESAIGEAGATLVQCVTGLKFSIAEAGAFKELRRQHRALNPRKKIALTTVDAHLTTVADGDATREVLVVDKVIEPIKPGKSCGS